MSTMRDEHARRAERGKLFIRMQREESERSRADLTAEIGSLTAKLDHAHTDLDVIHEQRNAALARVAELEAEINATKAPMTKTPTVEPAA